MNIELAWGRAMKDQPLNAGGRMNRKAARAFGLALWLCCGAAAGLTLLSPLLLEVNDGYDHGYGETAKWDIVGAFCGFSAALIVWELISQSRTKITTTKKP